MLLANSDFIVLKLSFVTLYIQIINQRESVTSKIFKEKEFNLQSLGIGGLGAEFVAIFRRAFTSRILPRDVVNRFWFRPQLFQNAISCFSMYSLFPCKFILLILQNWGKAR